MPPRIRKPPVLSPCSSSISPPVQSQCAQNLGRNFSSTPVNPTKLRREMFAWLNGPGKNFQYPLPNSTNYLSAYDRRGVLLRQNDNSASSAKSPGPDTPDSIALGEAATEKQLGKEEKDDLKPFPLNTHFVSQSVLSERLRNEIWRKVKIEKVPIRIVSVQMGVEMRRVAAVVRLVEVERRWREEGKPLAIPYAQAVHAMIPTTPFVFGHPTQHETINDLPVHALTHPQLFYPTSESRAFNRVDAGRVFSGAPRLPDSEDIGQGGTNAKELWNDKEIEVIGKKGYEREVLKSADSRIPHPHLIAHEKDKVAFAGENAVIQERYAQRLQDEEDEMREKKEKQRLWEEKNLKKIDTGRWQIIVKEVQATRLGTGLDGRGTQSPGYRYGVPSQDRKRAQVKIPTKVEV